MAHDRVDDEVGLAAGRVDRAVAAGHRPHAATRARAAPSRSASTGPPGSIPRAFDEAAPRRTRSRRAGRRTAPTSRRSASGSQVTFASENATIAAAARSHGGVLGADLAAARQLEHEVGAGLPGARGGRRRASRRRRRSARAARAGSRARGGSRRAPRSRPARRRRRRSPTRPAARRRAPGADAAPSHGRAAARAARAAPVADVGVDEQADRQPEHDREQRSPRLSNAILGTGRASAGRLLPRVRPRAAASAPAGEPLPRLGIAEQPDERVVQGAAVAGGTRRAAPAAATSPKPPTSLTTIGLPNASAVASTPEWSSRSVRE